MIFQLTLRLKEYISPFFNSKMSTDQLICPVLSSHVPKYIYIYFIGLKFFAPHSLGLWQMGQSWGREVASSSPCSFLVFLLISPTHWAPCDSSWGRKKSGDMNLSFPWSWFGTSFQELWQMIKKKKWCFFWSWAVLWEPLRYPNHSFLAEYVSLLTAYISLHNMGIE